MRFHLTEEQSAIQDAVRGTLAEVWPMERLHAFADGRIDDGADHDPTSWQALMALGIGGLVLPEADEVDVAIDERDLDIDVYRSSSAGGQSVNTTDSAVRITHRPTGVVVTMQDERSQLQNKARAMTVLRSRLLQLARDEHEAAMSIERRSQVGGGGRSEKIRTYNFKENRLTDHRIGLTIYRLADVLAGHLGEVVDALIADQRARQLASGE